MALPDPYKIMSRLANIDTLGTPPTLTMQLFSLAKDPKINITTIVEHILPNPTVCANLIKIANSINYNRGSTISTISHAVVHLGLRTVCTIVSAIELIGLFHNRDDKTGFSEATFWKHAYSGALLSRAIAKEQNVKDPETTYLAGLLRDMGIVVLRQYFPDVFFDIYSLASTLHLSFDKAAQSIGSLPHRHISYLLAVRWNLPGKILCVYQKPIDTLENYNEVMLDTTIVNFSDALLHEYGFCQWDKYQRPSPEFENPFNYSQEKKDALTASVFREVAEFSTSLNF